MPYITEEYYNLEYMGVEVSTTELPRFIKRASDLIDLVTNHSIKDFDSLPTFIQKQVQKATAAQVEFFEMQGGVEVATVGESLSNANIGKFSYGLGNNTANTTLTRTQEAISSMVIQHLKPTGLLYMGVGTRG